MIGFELIFCMKKLFDIFFCFKITNVYHHVISRSVYSKRTPTSHNSRDTNMDSRCMVGKLSLIHFWPQSSEAFKINILMNIRMKFWAKILITEMLPMYHLESLKLMRSDLLVFPCKISKPSMLVKIFTHFINFSFRLTYVCHS